jgi:hypothetical protein
MGSSPPPPGGGDLRGSMLWGGGDPFAPWGGWGGGGGGAPPGNEVQEDWPVGSRDGEKEGKLMGIGSPEKNNYEGMEVSENGD